MARNKAINSESDEEIPRDILTQILYVSGTDNRVQFDDVVDDFVTFLIAGKSCSSSIVIARLFKYKHNYRYMFICL